MAKSPTKADEAKAETDPVAEAQAKAQEIIRQAQAQAEAISTDARKAQNEARKDREQNLRYENTDGTVRHVIEEVPIFAPRNVMKIETGMVNRASGTKREDF